VGSRSLFTVTLKKQNGHQIIPYFNLADISVTKGCGGMNHCDYVTKLYKTFRSSKNIIIFNFLRNKDTCLSSHSNIFQLHCKCHNKANYQNVGM